MITQDKEVSRGISRTDGGEKNLCVGFENN